MSVTIPFRGDFFLGLTYDEVMLILSIPVHIFALLMWLKIGKWGNWLWPFLLVSIVVFNMLVIRVMREAALHGVISPEWWLFWTSTLFFVDSCLMAVSGWYLWTEFSQAKSRHIIGSAIHARLQRLIEDAAGRGLDVDFLAFWAAAESMPEGIALVDDENKILYVNNALCQMTGWKRDDLVRGPLTKIMPMHYQDRHTEKFKQYVETGQKTVNWEGLKVHVRHSDGREIPVEVSYAEFKIDGERTFVGLVRVDSERIASEALLAKAKTVAIELMDKAKDDAMAIADKAKDNAIEIAEKARADAIKIIDESKTAATVRIDRAAEEASKLVASSSVAQAAEKSKAAAEESHEAAIESREAAEQSNEAAQALKIEGEKKNDK